MKLLRLLLLFSILIMASCGSSPEVEDGENDTKEYIGEKGTAVCIWDDAYLRDRPSRARGKRLTGIGLAEKVMLSGKTKREGKSEFYEVSMLDSKNTKGWVLATLIIPEGRIATAITEIDIYKRPDLVTKMSRSFEQFDVFAIKGQQGNWLEVEGRRKWSSSIERGWIMRGENELYSYSEEDVVTSVYVLRSFKLETVEEKIEALESILVDGNLVASKHMTEVKKELRRLRNEIDPAFENMEPMDDVEMEVIAL